MFLKRARAANGKVNLSEITTLPSEQVVLSESVSNHDGAALRSPPAMQNGSV
ncbi:MAG: hypothetical protein AAGG51_23435 [Cyanobacteria bacterium P01_G01_bin.54]